MGPLPKRKISYGRRDRRRAHDALKPPNLVTCPEPDCGELTLPHRVCPSCGKYRGRQVIAIKEEK
ncbi:MAG: 50S ribosomal protein L32 [Anaerolineae bacterium]